jgi:hypothetical protein
LEWVSRAETENTTTLAFAREYAEGLAQKVALLEDDLAVERQAQEASKSEHQAHFEEFTVGVSYAAPQAHRIVNVALHWEYSLGIVFIFSQGRKDLYHV